MILTSVGVLFAMIFHVGTKERTGEKTKKLFTASGKFAVSPPQHKHFNLKTHTF